MVDLKMQYFNYSLKMSPT